MKNKDKILILMIFQALPIPTSILTIFGSFVSCANIGVVREKSLLLAFVFVITMMLAGTYTLTYVYSLKKTLANEKLSIISFLPIFHILVTIIFFVLEIILEHVYL